MQNYIHSKQYFLLGTLRRDWMQLMRIFNALKIIWRRNMRKKRRRKWSQPRIWVWISLGLSLWRSKWRTIPRPWPSWPCNLSKAKDSSVTNLCPWWRWWSTRWPTTPTTWSTPPPSLTPAKTSSGVKEGKEYSRFFHRYEDTALTYNCRNGLCN